MVRARMRQTDTSEDQTLDVLLKVWRKKPDTRGGNALCRVNDQEVQQKLKAAKGAPTLT
jgi:hypothetical protein